MSFKDTETVEVPGIIPLAGYDGRVDILLAPVIACLNKKGWRTKACCSGHKIRTKMLDGKQYSYRNRGGYIALYEEYAFPVAPPAKLNLCEVNPSSIYWEYISPQVNGQRMKDLLAWAKSFPDIA